MTLAITRYNVINSKIPKELSGYRMALLSDLHNCEIGRHNADLIAQVRELGPDVILLPGDAVNKNYNDKSPRGGYEHMIPLFKKLTAVCPVLYANGNHEQRFAERNGGGGYYGAYLKVLRHFGVNVLNNKGLYVARKRVRFVGLDLPVSYYSKKAAHGPGDTAFLNSLLGEADPQAYTVLLAHTPEYFKAYLDWGADLVVSGHIHGGMIRLPIYGGLLSPHRTFFPGYDYGRYREDGREMIVSGGIASPKFPPRFNNPPEIVLITLYPSQEDVPHATEC